MAEKRLLDDDPLTGVRSYHHYDESDDTFSIVTEQDCDPILEHNKATANNGLNKNSELWKAASIPMTVQMDWLVRYGVDLYNRDHLPAVKKLLNSSDYRHLRTGTFKL